MSKVFVGVDEVGTGAWAGPFLIIAVVAPDCSWTVKGLNDSKQLSAVAREDAVELIQASGAHWTGESVAPEVIDAIGFKNAYRAALGRVVSDAQSVAQHVYGSRAVEIVVDGNYAPTGTRCEVKADGKYPTVMAASILGKVMRDAEMVRIAAERACKFRFDEHKGYGTKQHKLELERWGPSMWHRRSFAPVKAEIEKRSNASELR